MSVHDARLSYALPAARIVAKDASGAYVLLGGLGVLGVGSRWFKASDDDRQSEAYRVAPIKERWE